MFSVKGRRDDLGGSLSTSATFPQKAGATRSIVRSTGVALLTTGLLVALFIPYQLWYTGSEQRRSQTTALEQLRQALPPAVRNVSPSTLPTGPAQTAPTNVAPVLGAWVGEIAIPKIGLTQAIIEGTGEGQLSKGPGHYPSTAPLGGPGNVALAGHRTTWGEPFRHLDQLRRNDAIIITTGSGRFLYRVIRNIVVSPNDAEVLAPSRINILTLTTCNPPYSAASRLVIQAELTNADVVTDVEATKHFYARVNKEVVGGNPSRAAAEALVIFDLVTLLGLALVLERWRWIWRIRRWTPLLILGIAIMLTLQLFHNALWALPAGW